jgi:hypothetical protein
MIFNCQRNCVGSRHQNGKEKQLANNAGVLIGWWRGGGGGSQLCSKSRRLLRLV